MARELIYLDNAATSWPKHPAVARAMGVFLDESAGNPGRGGHALARAASGTLDRARQALASMIHAPCASRVVLTHGCTDALNLAIHGVIRAQQRAGASTPIPVVSTTLEHNAVLRTLHSYEADGVIRVAFVGHDNLGRTDPGAVADACGPETALVCVTHASNALGTVQPVREIIERVRVAAPEALVLVDAAQTLGHLDIDVQRMDIDLLSIAGHKGLGGPTGTGALYVGPRAYADGCTQDTARVFCARRGGTGSIAPGLEMPDTLPDALEAGTSNAVGFAGLLAAIEHLDEGAHEHEMRLTARLLEGLGAIHGVTIHGVPTTEGRTGEGRTGVVLISIEGVCPREAARVLDTTHGIAVRGGVHCAPLTHDAIGTGADGGVRFSPGRSTTEREIDAAIDAVRALASGAARAAS